MKKKRRRPSILHVDDEKDIRDLVLIALKDIGGLDVTQFASGPDTIENADGIFADIFLFDVTMPEMSGPEMLERLRSIPKFSSTPAIFLTANSPTQILKDLTTPGIAAVLTKPFDPMTLADQIIEIWHSRDGCERPRLIGPV